MTNAWTPGPWQANDDGCLAKQGDRHRFIQIASPWIEGAFDARESAEVAANMRLLAAAPDLFDSLDPDTLEAIADEIDSFELSTRASGLRSIAKRQRAAMAKAAGEPVSADGLAEPSNASSPIDQGSTPGAVR